MHRTKFAYLELEFLQLHTDHGLTADDLTRVFRLSRPQATRILNRALAKDSECCLRLLEVLAGSRS
jgi:hypothetical protein